MNIKKLSLAAAVSALIFTTASNEVLGPIPIYLNPIKVDANHFNDLDTKATFASEIYTEKDIKKSNSSNLYDFLSQNTSVTISPNSGDRFTQKIDIRGFGLDKGFESIVVILDGRRLNNVDSVAASLSSLPINNIEKIEITKGSGSVVYGDGAMAGTIHIYTKKSNDSVFTFSKGNYGFQQSNIQANTSKDNLTLSAVVSNTKQGGYGVADSTGNKDWGKQDNKTFKAGYVVNNNTKITLNLEDNTIDNRYPNWMTLAAFNENPSQNLSGYDYSHIINKSTIKSLNIKHKLTDKLQVSVKSSNETKNITTFSSNDYDYKIRDVLFTYLKDNIKINGGRTSFNGKRIAPSNLTSKYNSGVFLKADYKLDDSTYTIGARRESVDYNYTPNSGTVRNASESINAFNIGINSQLNKSTSVFSNYNNAFQVPSIDNFFSTTYDSSPPYAVIDVTFNDFMDTAKIKTLNIGINHLTESTKTKLTLFRSNLKNELYYCKFCFKNTNLDKSHKYGLELQHSQQIDPDLLTNINYTYTVAKIDSENEESGAYNGKNLPMVSKHNITLSLDKKINKKSKIKLIHKYRSDAYSSEDFTNSATQKQKAFNSTNVNYLYQYDKNIDLTLNIENLFENKHGSWLRDNVIYPSGFTRNIKAGIEYRF